MPFKVDLGVLGGPAVLKWYDVRTGAYISASDGPVSGVQTIFPIENGGDGDYVLVAEASGK